MTIEETILAPSCEVEGEGARRNYVQLNWYVYAIMGAEKLKSFVVVRGCPDPPRSTSDCISAWHFEMQPLIIVMS